MASTVAKFATCVPHAFSPEQGAVLSHRFLAEQISIRAARRVQQVGTMSLQLDGMKRLEAKYETLTSAAGTLPDSPNIKAASKFGKWLHQNLTSLETDVAYVQEQLKDALKSQVTRHEHETEQQENKSAGSDSNAPISVGSVDTDIHQLVEETGEDCRAFCIEKNGEAPDVKVLSSLDLPLRDTEGRMLKQAPRCLIVEGHVHFILMEVLKNSMGAMVAHWGSDLIDADPIQIQVAGRGNEVGIRISDRGGGIPVHHRCKAMDFFHTSAAPMKATYGYSKAHGAAFTGMGVGLPMARLYARLCGGDLSFNVLPGFGTDTFIILNRTADVPFPT